MIDKKLTLAALVFVLALLPARPVGAQDEEEAAEKELGLKDRAELSLVRNSGNSESEAFRLKNSLSYRTEQSEFRLEMGALRAESTIQRRRAVGTSRDDLRLLETSDTALSAEQYFLRGRYDRVISDALFWYVGAGWERNQFAGFRGRSLAEAGVGHLWWDRDDSRFRTSYGLTYTQQDDLVPDPRTEDAFAGVRVGWEYWRQVTPSTNFGSELTVDENVDDTEDLRADFTNWIGVKISQRLALRVSLQMLFDNQPSLIELPLEAPNGQPTGRTVRVPLEELDTTLSTALVVDF